MIVVIEDAMSDQINNLARVQELSIITNDEWYLGAYMCVEN